jgi:hypothetical protein
VAFVWRVTDDVGVGIVLSSLLSSCGLVLLLLLVVARAVRLVVW